jgi:polysaccharide biosynthesis transport protein
LTIVRRRIHWLIWPALSIFLIAAAVALFLPNIFKSEAIILIEGTQVTEALVPSTVTSFADQRIQSISQQVMSRSKILELVKKFDLLPELRKTLSTDALVEKVKESIGINPISAEIKTAQSNSPSFITIAFKLSFENGDPVKTQQVTSELASFFLARNLKARQESARGTTDFLDKQLEKAKEATTDLERDIAAFKEAHLEELPEFMNLNLQKIEKINSDMNDVSRELISLKEQDVSIRSELSVLDPYSGDARTSKILTVKEQLKQLELKRAELKSKYSEEHPTVKALEKEIQILSKTGEHSKDLIQKRERLQELEQEFAQLTSRYSEEHPLVKRNKAEIAELKKDIASTENSIAKETKASLQDVHDVTNPAYISLKSELERIGIRLKSLEGERRRLATERESIYDKLKTMPGVEKKYKELTSDYDNVKSNLTELQRKVQVARIAEGMEEGQLGEKFTMIEPPFLPETPYRPNRIAIILIGLVLGLGSGLGLAALKEMGDHSIRRPEVLERLTGHRVLTVIPYIKTPADRRRKTLKATILSTSAVAVSVFGVTFFHYRVMDLYIFYDKVLKFFGERFYFHF